MTGAIDEPDGRPGHYYVSVRDGHRWSLLYGPFDRHADALAAVDMTRRAAENVDRRAAFYAFGTARTADDWTPPPAGVLNSLLPPIAAVEIQTEDDHATTDG